MATAHAATVRIDITTAISERTGLTPVEVAKAAAFLSACQRAGVSLDHVQAALYAVRPANAERIRDEYVRLLTGEPERKVVGE